MLNFGGVYLPTFTNAGKSTIHGSYGFHHPLVTWCPGKRGKPCNPCWRDRLPLVAARRPGNGRPGKLGRFFTKNPWRRIHGKRSPRWWFQLFLIFTPILGKIPILTHFFQLGWNHQLVSVGFHEFLNAPRNVRLSLFFQRHRNTVALKYCWYASDGDHNLNWTWWDFWTINTVDGWNPTFTSWGW